MLLTIVGLWLLVAASPARAIPPIVPDFTETHPTRFDFTFLFENDNKFFAIWRVFGTDGSDLGRTHGLTLRLGGPILRGAGGRWDFEIASNLFMTQLYAPDGTRLNIRENGLPDPQRWQNRNVWFNEISTARVVVTRPFARNPRFSYQLGIGGVVSNHENVGAGGTGQQKWFHKFLAVFGQYTREYRYLSDDMGVYGGLTLDANMRWARTVHTRRYFRVALRADLGVSMNTIAYGSHLLGSAGLWLGVGQRRWHDNPVMHLAFTQQLQFFPESQAPLFDLRIDWFFHTKPVDLLFTFDGYFGDPNRPYYTYNFNNTTVTMGMRFRFSGTDLN